MAKISSKNEQAGQALLEWIVFGMGVLLFWTASLHMAKRLLHRTAVESWSVLAARQGLSKAQTVLLPEMTIKSRRQNNFGQATIQIDRYHATSHMIIPQKSSTLSDKEVPFSSTLFSFGSLSSLFLE